VCLAVGQLVARSAALDLIGLEYLFKRNLLLGLKRANQSKSEVSSFLVWLDFQNCTSGGEDIVTGGGQNGVSILTDGKSLLGRGGFWMQILGSTFFY